ncbi:Threonine aldolase [Coelomomyces lativittatus]|nr:Threonine aldolase [Coelomomyces lativittatus]
MHFLSSFRRIHFHGYLKSPWNYIHDKKVTWSHHRSLSQLTPAFDFRSDTVTQPTSEMLQAMVRAPCGDDVYQEDPTVQLLERRVADLFGHEAALFVSSGTLSNQLGVRVHLPQPPSTVVCDARAHMYVAELGGLAFHSRAQVFPVTQWNEYFATYVASDPDWQAPTQLVCFENTLCGSVLELPNFQAWTSQAKQLGLKVHLDGARIWHAAVATQTSLHAYGALSDSVSVCFSKALGAPVGSCLIGPKDFIQKARRFRKLFGGA